MKKRYVDASRLRKMKKLRITEKLSESAYTFLKFMMMWTLVLLADFVLEFRLEYLWPCWLFFGSVYTTFHCHGLRRACVYQRIGYPVVYLGFDATCYFTNIFKLRIQKAVQSENDFHMHLLQHSLPPGLQVFPKTSTDGSSSNSKWKTKPESSQYQCQNGSVVNHDEAHTVDCLQICSEERTTEKGTQEVKPGESNRRPSSSKHTVNESRDLLHSGAGGPESSTAPDNLPQEEQGSKAARAAKSSSPKARRGSSNTPSPPAARTEKKQRSSSKTVSPNRDMADKSATAAQNHHAEQMTKLEQEMRRLRSELQASRQSEQELRSHVCNLTNSERSLRPEVSLLRQSNMLLQSKILCLTKTKQRDKQTSVMLEKKTRAETEARLSAEKQLAELQAQKLEEAASAARSLTNRQEHSETQMLRKRVKDLETEYKQLQLEYQVKESRVVDLESSGKYRCVEKETDMLLSTLSAMQEKAQHLEYNLSAETRIKLDLFSALGDARRQLEIAQDKVMKQDREISEMKQKIAEVMAVSPGVSYMALGPRCRSISPSSSTLSATC
ncbi:hypothetical protein INR49_026323 [Caranx melampygus]|nr:hypothetical protein INR49_026323 [Caranx melampygus]